MGAAGAAGGASLASMALGAASSVIRGQGEKAGLDVQAERAERAAAFGKVQADLTDTKFREELNTTLQNIDVIRAAGRIDPTSPTTAVIQDRQRMISERQRLAAVGSIKAQVTDDESSAKYLRKAGDMALKLGYLSAGTKIASGLSKFAGSMGGGE